MSKQPDYLRDAQIHELIGGVFGWLSLASSLALLVWFIAAIFSHWSWWAVLGWLLLGGFLKAVSRQYTVEAQKSIQQGVAAGKLYIADTGQALRTGAED